MTTDATTTVTELGTTAGINKTITITEGSTTPNQTDEATTRLLQYTEKATTAASASASTTQRKSTVSPKTDINGPHSTTDLMTSTLSPVSIATSLPVKTGTVGASSPEATPHPAASTSSADGTTHHNTTITITTDITSPMNPATSSSPDFITSPDTGATDSSTQPTTTWLSVKTTQPLFTNEQPPTDSTGRKEPLPTEGFPTTRSEEPIPEEEIPTDEPNNLALIVGVSCGVGAVLIGGVIAGAVYHHASMKKQSSSVSPLEEEEVAGVELSQAQSPTTENQAFSTTDINI